MDKIYQLIIIGAGPAGITAGIYAKRYRINFLLIGNIDGGTINEAHLVENYPGFKSVTGNNLSKEFQKHLAVKTIKEQVVRITKKASVFKIKSNKNEYHAQALILGLGMKTRKLNIKNEEKFLNKEIYYYTSNNLGLFKNKRIAVIGGGDSALSSAIKISANSKKTYIILRRDEFRGAPSLVKKAEQNKNIEIIYKAHVKEVNRGNKLEKIILDDKRKIEVDYLFIEIGGVPNINLCKEINIETDGNFIKTDKNQATNVSGVFAAGDITNNPLKQIVTAAAEGAIAVTSAYKYLNTLK